jgi:hypothetical protein
MKACKSIKIVLIALDRVLRKKEIIASGTNRPNQSRDLGAYFRILLTHLKKLLMEELFCKINLDLMWISRKDRQMKGEGGGDMSERGQGNIQ